MKTKALSFHTLYAVDQDILTKHNGIDYTLAKGKTCLIPAQLGEYHILAANVSTVIRSSL